MPNCFTLTRKSDPDAGPVTFAQIDEELCKHLGVECHPKQYYLGWYDGIGYALAIGKNWDQIRETLREYNYDEEAFKIVDFLEENFVANAWAEIGRRS